MAATRQDVGSGSRGAWALVVLCVVLGAVGGFLYYLVQDKVYSAQSTVLVLPTAGGLDSSVDGSRTSTTVQIDTEAQVAASALVAAAAAIELPGTTPQELLDNTSVSVTPNSAVLVFTYEAGTAFQAQAGAQAMANAYLTLRSDAAAAAKDASEKALNATKDGLTKAFDANVEVIRDEGSSAGDRAAAVAKNDLLVGQISDINSRLVALGVTTTEGGQVISAAQLPSAPISPILWVDLAAGLLIGGLVGSGILLLDRRRTAAAESGGQLEQALPALPVTRVVPVPTTSVGAPPSAQAIAAPDPEWKPAPSVDLRPTDEPAAPHVSHDAGTGFEVLASLVLDGSGPVAEGQQAALRALSAEVSKAGTHDGPVVLVGVDYPGLMAQAAFAINDAWVSERGGSALVLTEPGTPTVPGRPTAAGRGLTDVLSGEWSALDTVVPMAGSRSAVVGHGQDATHLPAATQRRRLQGFWSDLDGAYGSTLVHVQVPFDDELAQSVMQTAGPVLLVVKSGLTQQQDLAYAIEQLTWLGVVDHVVGVVSVSGAARSTAAAPPMTARQKAKAEQAAAAAAQAKADAKAEAQSDASEGTDVADEDAALTSGGADRGGA